MPKTIEQIEARWLPLPPPKGACPVSGLKRSHLLLLLKRYPTRIKAANIREPGSRRGRWLIYWPSLHNFINGEAEATRHELTAGELATLPTAGGGGVH
ncbi:MAG: hypothetical protein JJT96_10065 [Opitutales bacterium]|nr:hypothetical protein [Opitutales bacterium]